MGWYSIIRVVLWPLISYSITKNIQQLFILLFYSCWPPIYVYDEHFRQNMEQPGMVVNPARCELIRESNVYNTNETSGTVQGRRSRDPS